MVECEAIKRDNTKCTYPAKNGSKFCGHHKRQDPSYSDQDRQNQEISKELEELRREIIKSSQKWVIIGIVATFLITLGVSSFYYQKGVKNSIELAKEEFGYALELSKPVILKIEQEIDEKAGRVVVNVTNTHSLKQTGTINLYRLELNPDRPHMSNQSGIHPGETIQYNLAIKSWEEEISFSATQSPGVKEMTFPSALAYFVNEYAVISYKITCDNCPSGGFIKRIPDFGVFNIFFTIDIEGFKSVSMPFYSWVDYKPEDIIQKESSNKTTL